jgi:O-antigen/teichoic acid export membrane protein
MVSLKHKTISGIKWTLVTSIVQRVISFGTTIVLARILSPADFGLFALAFVMIDGFGVFKSLGFDSALVRRKDDIEKACNTAFFLIPAMGMTLFVILFFFAPIGAKFLNNSQVTPIIRTLALIFVITTFGKVPQTILYRDMKFKYKSIAEVSGLIVYSSTALVLALNGFGVWSLVVAYVLRNLIQISIEWHFSGWKPKFEFDKAIAWDMFHFGKFISLGAIIGFLSSNLDNILIGKLLGVTMLGYYAIAMNMATFLSQYFLNKIGFIMYPAYSKIQDDLEDAKRVMLKALRYISMLIFPFSFFLCVFAYDILRLVVGEKWIPATNVLKVLAFVGIFRAFGTVIWPLLLAKGKSKADYQISLAQFLIFLVLIIPLAIKFKLLGVGFAVLFSAISSFAMGLVRLKKYLLIDSYVIFKTLKPVFLCATLILFIGFFFSLVDVTGNTNFNFFISASVSLIAYLIGICFLNKNFKKVPCAV